MSEYQIIRSYTMGVELADNNSEIVFKQGDFSTYFTSRQNVINGDNSEGIIVDFSGEPTGGLTNIDHTTFTIRTLV